MNRDYWWRYFRNGLDELADVIVNAWPLIIVTAIIMAALVWP